MTRSSSFTYTEAKYVASKLGADLLNLNARYGYPSRSDIEDYVVETALHLQRGYLDTVDFGFKDGDRWVLRLRYAAVAGGQLRDEPPGGLPSAYDVAGYRFQSYLTRNSAYWALTETQRVEFDKTLPIHRTPGHEPTANAGSFGSDSQYSRNGNGVSRNVYTAF
jgi:hypothetical protein